MVMFAPGGIAGLMQMHAPLVRARLMRRLALPYLRVLVPGLATTLGFIALVELYSFVSIGKAQGKALSLFGQPVTGETAIPWLIGAALLIVGLVGLRWQGRIFRQNWDALMEQTKGAPRG
jgi:branched-chain amino acid transport system permease protein